MVQITKRYIFITIAGVEESFLEPLLSYTHRSFVREPIEGHPYRTREVTKYEKKKLYGQLPDGGFLFQHGLLPRVIQALDKAKLEYKIDDSPEGDRMSPDYDAILKAMPGLKLRNNQDVILSMMFASSCGQVVAPPGFGKTFLIGLMCLAYPKARIIVATPGADLARDTYRRLCSTLGEKQVGLTGAGGNTMGRVTVCTYHSLHKIPPDKINMVLTDESHRSPCSMLAEPLSKLIHAQKTLGFTATPVGRSDNAEMVAEALLGPVMITIDYQTAQTAGTVAPMDVVMVDVTSGPPDEDYSKSELVTKRRNMYWKNVYRNKRIVEAVNHFTGPDNALGLEDPSVLILVETTSHLVNLSRMLPGFEVVYKSVGRSGLPKLKPKELRQLFEDFQSGKIKKVLSTCCWGTGVDFPDLDVIVMASGKGSPIETVQNTGRATRTGSDGQKKGYVLDFKDSWSKWASGRAKSRMREYKKMGWTIHG